MITFREKGDLSKFTNYLKKAKLAVTHPRLEKYGQEGVAALRAATPKDTGLTSDSWSYQIIRTPNGVTINFNNSNVQNGVPIAIILQYGHATRNGGWVEGRDYINPAIQPIFDKLAKEAWEEVTKL